MKRTLLVAFLLMVASGAANAGLSFQSVLTAYRTETFNGVAGLPGYGLGTAVSLGSLLTNQTGTITFTYLGQESGYNDSFHLNINGTNLYESNPIGTSVSAAVVSLGAINFSFEGDVGRFAYNGGTWTAGTSIGLIGTDMTVTQGTAAGKYAFVLGYNDSAGSTTLGDWDDFVVGVNFTPTTVTPVPEPEIYAMMIAGLGFMGFVRRRSRKNRGATT